MNLFVQAHVLMENVYVKLFNNPNHEKLPSVLQELLTFESILESIYQAHVKQTKTLIRNKFKFNEQIVLKIT